MGDYSVGPSSRGWYTLFGFAVVGFLSIFGGAILLLVFLLHHIRWVS